MKCLVVAAHPDDEILGCGGTLARWSDEGHEIHILLMSEGVTSRDDNRDVIKRKKELESIKKASVKASKKIGAASIEFLDFPDNRMDTIDLLDVVKSIEKKINKLKPSTVLTHHFGDLNIDHSIIHKAVITACRPEKICPVKKILSFEVNSSTEWNSDGNQDFKPNFFVDISNFIDCKLAAFKFYESEIKEGPHPRSIEGIKTLAKFRGQTVGFEFAESFILIREIN